MAIGGPSKAHSDDDEDPGVFGEINITPLTDIFLVLLIIFMVTSTALVEQGQSGAGGVRVDLPKGAAKELAQESHDFPIAITADGQLAAEGKAIGLDQLRARLAEVARSAPDTQIIVQADENAHHGRVVEVIEACKAVGLSRFAIATDAQ